MNRARNERLAQTIHILNKDIRHLRAELALFGGLLAVFGLTHGRFPTYPSWALLGVGAGYLIARLIQAETIPGDDQLWITRPYHRVSLAAAKILFLVLFVNLPLFVVQMGIFLSQGFGVLENVAGILWTQCLLLFLVSIPIAAIASLTRGISGFALCGLILIGTVRGLDAFTSGAMTAVPANTLWIRYILPGLIIAITAVVILRLQYGSRRTRLSRILAAAALAAAFLAIPYLPSAMPGPRSCESVSIRRRRRETPTDFWNRDRSRSNCRSRSSPDRMTSSSTSSDSRYGSKGRTVTRSEVFAGPWTDRGALPNRRCMHAWTVRSWRPTNGLI
jgi:hypothetical protein